MILTAMMSPKDSFCDFGVLPPHGYAWGFAMWWVGMLDRGRKEVPTFPKERIWDFGGTQTHIERLESRPSSGSF
jgi:hypothetical protein